MLHPVVIRLNTHTQLCMAAAPHLLDTCGKSPDTYTLLAVLSPCFHTLYPYPDITHVRKAPGMGFSQFTVLEKLPESWEPQLAYISAMRHPRLLFTTGRLLLTISACLVTKREVSLVPRPSPKNRLRWGLGTRLGEVTFISSPYMYHHSAKVYQKISRVCSCLY